VKPTQAAKCPASRAVLKFPECRADQRYPEGLKYRADQKFQGYPDAQKCPESLEDLKCRAGRKVIHWQLNLC
jgi:hypothetical protein